MTATVSRPAVMRAESPPPSRPRRRAHVYLRDDVLSVLAEFDRQAATWQALASAAQEEADAGVGDSRSIDAANRAAGRAAAFTSAAGILRQALARHE